MNDQRLDVAILSWRGARRLGAGVHPMQRIGWGKTEAPEPTQRMFDFDPSVLGALQMQEAAVPAMA